MSHIDTLKAYDELILSGTPDKQAREQIGFFTSSIEGLATKEDLKTAINMLEKDIKLFIASLVGITVILSIILPIATTFISKKFGWG